MQGWRIENCVIYCVIAICTVAGFYYGTPAGLWSMLLLIAVSSDSPISTKTTVRKTADRQKSETPE